MTDKWKPNELFLEYLLERNSQKGEDADKTLLFAKGKYLSFRELVEEMRLGSALGKEIYHRRYQEDIKAFEEYANRKAFEDYKRMEKMIRNI